MGFMDKGQIRQMLEEKGYIEDKTIPDHRLTEEINRLRKKKRGHPECEEPVLLLAKHIGSTTSLLTYVKKNRADTFIVATDTGIFHQMKKACPGKTGLRVRKDSHRPVKTSIPVYIFNQQVLPGYLNGF